LETCTLAKNLMMSKREHTKRQGNWSESQVHLQQQNEKVINDNHLKQTQKSNVFWLVPSDLQILRVWSLDSYKVYSSGCSVTVYISISCRQSRIEIYLFDSGIFATQNQCCVFSNLATSWELFFNISKAKRKWWLEEDLRPKSKLNTAVFSKFGFSLNLDMGSFKHLGMPFIKIPLSSRCCKCWQTFTDTNCSVSKVVFCGGKAEPCW